MPSRKARARYRRAHHSSKTKGLEYDVEEARAEMNGDTVPVDWRGVPITEGCTLIYGAGVGRSVAMVEAVYEGKTTPSGRLWVRVVRRAYGSTGSAADLRVHIGADRVTVVDSLPASDTPTEDEKIRTDCHRRADYHRKRIAELTQPGWAASEATAEEVGYHQRQLRDIGRKLGELAKEGLK
jgi:hypothetical protein